MMRVDNFGMRVGALLLTLASGCASISQEASQEGQARPSRAMSVSRARIPTAGGQTIRVPETAMADARELWSPFDADELREPLPPDGGAADVGLWLPVSERAVMRRYLQKLTGKRRELTHKVLGRADGYLPGILEELARRGLPAELACLPMVESAFEPGAVSRAGAAGLWQLMPETARRFGLIVNDSVDERFDARKSTAAAAAYLTTLYRLFRDWPLALAAYNCGEGAMRRALANTHSASLSEVTRVCRRLAPADAPLAEETLQFVPQFAAAVRLMTTGGKLGPDRPAPASTADHGQALRLSGQYRTAPQGPAPPRSNRISIE